MNALDELDRVEVTLAYARSAHQSYWNSLVTLCSALLAITAWMVADLTRLRIDSWNSLRGIVSALMFSSVILLGYSTFSAQRSNWKRVMWPAGADIDEFAFHPPNLVAFASFVWVVSIMVAWLNDLAKASVLLYMILPPLAMAGIWASKWQPGSSPTYLQEFGWALVILLFGGSLFAGFFGTVALVFLGPENAPSIWFYAASVVLILLVYLTLILLIRRPRTKLRLLENHRNNLVRGLVDQGIFSPDFSSAL